VSRRFGTVRKLASGRHQAIHQHATTRRQVARSFETQRQAEEWLAEERTRLRTGQWFDPAAGQVRLDDYFEAWLLGRPLAPRTVELYEWLWSKHIGTDVGCLQLGQLNPTVVRLWHASLARAKRPGPTTVAKCYRLLSTVISSAVRDGVIVRHPCTVTGAGVEPRRQIRVLGVEDIEKLAGAVPERSRALVLLAGYGGLRWGEATGLAPTDVDLEACTVTVRRALSEHLDGTLTLGPPKTSAGYRTVTLPASVSSELADHIELFGSSDLVFPTVTGLPMRRPNFTQIWKRATASADLEGVRFHDLRHTAATLATRNGATVREVQARLGHASPAAALRYQHVVAGADRELAQRLDSLRGASR
jgi:integrase